MGESGIEHRNSMSSGEALNKVHREASSARRVGWPLDKRRAARCQAICDSVAAVAAAPPCIEVGMRVPISTMQIWWPRLGLEWVTLKNVLLPLRIWERQRGGNVARVGSRFCTYQIPPNIRLGDVSPMRSVVACCLKIALSCKYISVDYPIKTRVLND